MFIVSIVTFSDGKQDRQILDCGRLGADKAHHLHQDSERRFWQGWKQVTGGQYQALEAASMVDAIIEAH